MPRIVKKPGIDELTFIADITNRYYKLGETQQHIASELKISQTEVSRYLKEAENQGIVKKTIEVDLHFTQDLGQKIKLLFPHIKEARIVPVLQSPERGGQRFLLQALGRASAEFFAENVHANHKIGLGCGVSIEAMVNAYLDVSRELDFLPQGCHIYPLMLMSMQDVVSVAPSALTSVLMRHLTDPIGYGFQFPELGDGECIRFVTKDEAGKEKLEDFSFFQLQAVKKWRRAIENLDHYFVGIGAIDYKGDILKIPRRNTMATYAFNMLIWASTSSESKINVVSALKSIGAASEILYQAINSRGAILNDKDVGIIQDITTFFRKYCTALSLSKLRERVKNPKDKAVNIVAIAGGKDKHQAVHAALYSEVFNVLITDTLTAAYVIEQEENKNRRDTETV